MAETTNGYGPSYYRRGTVDVWDFIRMQGLNFHLGNVIKYVCRAGYKDNDIEDLKKQSTTYKMRSNLEPNTIARTGRVQQWIDNPNSRLPVSCTVFVVEDSMEGPNGIEASWRFVSHALRYGAGVAVHLSKLRPAGTETNKGIDTLIASGPTSFGKIYSTLNEILRRGGRTATVLVFSILTLHILILIPTLKLLGPIYRGLKGVSTLEEKKTGVIQNLKQRKQSLEALQEGTFGLTK